MCDDCCTFNFFFRVEHPDVGPNFNNVNILAKQTIYLIESLSIDLTWVHMDNTMPQKLATIAY